MDSDSNPRRSVQCTVHGVPAPHRLYRLEHMQGGKNDAEKRTSPFSPAGSAADRSAGAAEPERPAEPVEPAEQAESERPDGNEQ